MKTITGKIFLPLTITLIVVFASLTILVVSFTQESLRSDFDKNAKEKVEGIINVIDVIYTYEKSQLQSGRKLTSLDDFSDESIENLNRIIYDDVDPTQAYPFIKDRENRYIGYYDQNKIGQVAKSADKVTGEDLTEKYFSIGEGELTYFYSRSGYENEVFPKIGYVEVYEPLNWVVVYSVYEDVVLEAQNRILFTLILTSSLAILICSGLVFIILNVVVKSLRITASSLEDIASGHGDLTKDIDVHSKDEVGQVSTSFNNFVSKLRIMVINIKSISHKSSQLGQDLSANAEEISSSLKEIVTTVGSIDEMSQVLSEHSENGNKLLTDIQKAISQVEKEVETETQAVDFSVQAMNKIVQAISLVDSKTDQGQRKGVELAELAGSSSQKMVETRTDIQEISNSVEDIQEVVEVIKGFADQTNLLAMNAAIEAAHAGEAGKGFAVVAVEIRNLAESTGESVKNITQSVEGIVSKIERASKISIEAEELIKQVKGNSQDVSQIMSDVSTSLDLLAQDNKQVITSIDQLKISSDSVSHSAQDVKSKANEAHESLQKITDYSAQNHRGVKEIHLALAESVEAITQIANLVTENKENLANINDLIGNFKVD